MTPEIDRRGFMKGSALMLAGAWGLKPMLVSGADQTTHDSPSFTDERASSIQSGQQVPLAPPDKQPPDLKIPEMVKRKVGYAIVGLGKLSLEQILPAFNGSTWSEPVALVSGHPEKARKVAEFYRIDPSNIYDYSNYDRIAENNRIDAIYIVLPNNMHAEYTIRGLRAGKHVLCEKPMSVNVSEGEQMIKAAQEAKKKLMIAYRLHYEPFNQKVMELSRQKAYGKIKTFSASNCQDVKAPNIRLSKQLGGGPIGDVGVYCINAARYVIGEEPTEVSAFSHHPKEDPRFREVPESVVFTMRYPSGLLAHCECGFGSARSDRYRAVGDKGFIEMDPAFGYQGQRLFMKEGAGGGGEEQKSEIKLQPVNHFASEMDHFADCVLNNKPVRTPGEMGLADMRIVVALTESHQRGGAAIAIQR